MKALEWCIESGFKLVNVSLGTIDYRDFAEIRETVNYAYKCGVVIVAALNNRNIYTYPASLTNVIGVKTVKNVSRDGTGYFYFNLPSDGAEIAVYGIHHIKDYLGEIRETIICNSYSAPFITAKVHEIIKTNTDITFEGICVKLREGASVCLPEKYIPNLQRRIDWVEKSVVFKIEKRCNVHFPLNLHVKEEMSVTCTDFCDALKKIANYMEEHLIWLSDTDTVIVLNSMKHLGSDVNWFFRKMDRLGKHIVFLDDQWLDYKLRGEKFHPARKFWYPFDCSLASDILKECNIEVPMIVLYDETGQAMDKIIYSLIELFYADGYNPVAATNSVFGAVLGMEYIQFDNEKPESTVQGIKSLYTAFDPDVILYGISLNQGILASLSLLESMLEPDIKVWIIDRYTNLHNGVRNTVHPCETIFISPNYDYQDIQQQYAKILQLFEIEQQLKVNLSKQI